MPTPVSRMETRTLSPVITSLAESIPPAGVNLMAFCRRLIQTCCSISQIAVKFARRQINVEIQMLFLPERFQQKNRLPDLFVEAERRGLQSRSPAFSRRESRRMLPVIVVSWRVLSMMMRVYSFRSASERWILQQCRIAPDGGERCLELMETVVTKSFRSDSMLFNSCTIRLKLSVSSQIACKDFEFGT